MPVLLKLMVIKYENVIKGTYQRPTKFIRKRSNLFGRCNVKQCQYKIINYFI